MYRLADSACISSQLSGKFQERTHRSALLEGNRGQTLYRITHRQCYLSANSNTRRERPPFYTGDPPFFKWAYIFKLHESPVSGALSSGKSIASVLPECEKRVRERDNKCLITGEPVKGDPERDPLGILLTDLSLWWNFYGIPALITDPETTHPSEIDTVQNVILITPELAVGWANGRFRVDMDVSL
ncbi:hypothetical protein M422DRAFT_46723 [Sphaerobolus stellatus SS14]|uniref:HNH nuclease domain-containing protein n=1 Tax=Sphaerobolus stellatus (strain SS14) TaxID=990650 RepID=A0A0C9W3E0_SPHS4|nr:hypothetical protein M422DRAFT_46723 [Sphaerobolus stellatus SS14]